MIFAQALVCRHLGRGESPSVSAFSGAGASPSLSGLWGFLCNNLQVFVD